MALARAARLLGKRADVGSSDGVPDIYRFLPERERVLKEPQPGAEYDLVAAVDVDGFERLGAFGPAARQAPLYAVIDHHVSSAEEGMVDLRACDTSAAATAEIVFDVLKVLKVPLDVEIATHLMTGILTDTGSFRFSNVRPRTFAIAETLAEAGAHPGPIFKEVYERRPFSTVKLLGLVLARCRQSCRGKVVWAVVSRRDFEEAGAKEEETEGIVNHLTTVATAEAAVLMRETLKGDVRVSLRTAGRLDAQEIARKFGGGGHRMAAGCTLPGPLDRAEAELIACLESLAQALP